MTIFKNVLEGREIFTSEKGVVHLPERSERSYKAEGKKDWVTWGNHEMSRECLVGKEETGPAPELQVLSKGGRPWELGSGHEEQTVRIP